MESVGAAGVSGESVSEGRVLVRRNSSPDYIEITLATMLAGVFLAAVWRLGVAFSSLR